MVDDFVFSMNLQHTT